MLHQKGEGQTLINAVDYDGARDEIAIRVMGRDRITGEWASFTVLMTWGAFNVIQESAYEQREDYAQQRIC